MSQNIETPKQAKKQKKKKPQRLKARQPRGFVDRDSDDIRAGEQMMSTIRSVYERYGFDPVETPMFEYTDALGKFLPDTDRPNEGVFSLLDDDEQWMSLRYDLTAPLARHFAQNINDLQTPYRTYRAGYVFRNEKPGPGRFRQFMQFDADTVGAPNPSADAEMCMMMADTMEALGIARGDYVVRVNNRKVLDGVMEAIGIGGDENDDRRLGVLRAIDKLDKFGIEGVRLLLGDGRMDDSGDFTKGAGLDKDQADFVLAQISGEPNADATSQLNSAMQAGIAELAQIKDLIDGAGYGPDQIKIDPSVVRGLEYYTGPVYECELTFPVTNEKGETVTFGSVAGGGRYDGLVKRFTGQDIPATGFSIGVSRLMTALKNLGKLQANTVLAPVVVCVMDRDNDALAGYQRMVQELRVAGIRAEMYQGNPKQFGKQLQYADRRGSPIAIIQGSDEREAGEVQVKDLVEGMRLSQQISDNEEWRASRPAQQTIKRADLVSTVQSILSAQETERSA
ncbi:MAG: histidine--tRNA ligase [Rhizobiaceae bacterium]|nr:histidine--tRNA ligase [Rhizobiaceae bacterium]